MFPFNWAVAGGAGLGEVRAGPKWHACSIAFLPLLVSVGVIYFMCSTILILFFFFLRESLYIAKHQYNKAQTNTVQKENQPEVGWLGGWLYPSSKPQV
jgi:hypothetical protein